MTRANYGANSPSELTFHMMSFTLPMEFGEKMGGRSVRLREEMKLHSPDRDELVQYWTPAGGREWLAVRYEYSRRR